MNAYTIFLMSISITLAYENHEERDINVGTVLFSPSDVKRNEWDKTGLSLLAARRYFQKLIPPRASLNVLDDNYVNTLLDYFREAYVNINEATKDPEVNSVMTLALSDVIGGYLKLWVLPVAKYCFYGGTLSHESTLKLYQFYNNLKNYLNTDGEGWRSPNFNALDSIAIKIAPPPRVTMARSTRNSCKNLIFYEQTPDELSIPTPQVNWYEPTITMFVPLKNESLVSLKSPTDSLLKYYYLAKDCLHSRNASNEYDFDNRFQSWLLTDVLPHLNDGDLYLAFYSVLSLVNRTRDLCDRIIEYYGPSILTGRQTLFTKFSLTFNKFDIVAVILFLEVAWCVVALLYMFCFKRKRNKHSDFGESKNTKGKMSNVYNICENGNDSYKSRKYPKNEDLYYSSESETRSYLYDSHFYSDNALKMSNKPQISTLKVKRIPTMSTNLTTDIYPVKDSAQFTSVTSTLISNHIGTQPTIRKSCNITESLATLQNIEMNEKPSKLYIKKTQLIKRDVVCKTSLHISSANKPQNTASEVSSEDVCEHIFDYESAHSSRISHAPNLDFDAQVQVTRTISEPNTASINELVKLKESSVCRKKYSDTSRRIEVKPTVTVVKKSVPCVLGPDIIVSSKHLSSQASIQNSDKSLEITKNCEIVPPKQPLDTNTVRKSPRHKIFFRKHKATPENDKEVYHHPKNVLCNQTFVPNRSSEIVQKIPYGLKIMKNYQSAKDILKKRPEYEFICTSCCLQQQNEKEEIQKSPCKKPHSAKHKSGGKYERNSKNESTQNIKKYGERQNLKQDSENNNLDKNDRTDLKLKKINQMVSASVSYSSKETETHVEKATSSPISKEKDILIAGNAVIVPNQIEDDTEKRYCKKCKASRIPKLVDVSNIKETTTKHTTSQRISTSSPRQRSFIPQPKKRTMDDVDIKRKKFNASDYKLNTTL